MSRGTSHSSAPPDFFCRLGLVDCTSDSPLQVSTTEFPRQRTTAILRHEEHFGFGNDFFSELKILLSVPVLIDLARFNPARENTQEPVVPMKLKRVLPASPGDERRVAISRRNAMT
eukprot:PhM_4_TR18660/c3_g1_i1/m.19879